MLKFPRQVYNRSSTSKPKIEISSGNHAGWSYVPRYTEIYERKGRNYDGQPQYYGRRIPTTEYRRRELQPRSYYAASLPQSSKTADYPSYHYKLDSDQKINYQPPRAETLASEPPGFIQDWAPLISPPSEWAQESRPIFDVNLADCRPPPLPAWTPPASALVSPQSLWSEPVPISPVPGLEGFKRFYNARTDSVSTIDSTGFKNMLREWDEVQLSHGVDMPQHPNPPRSEYSYESETRQVPTPPPLHTPPPSTTSRTPPPSSPGTHPRPPLYPSDDYPLSRILDHLQFLFPLKDPNTPPNFEQWTRFHEATQGLTAEQKKKVMDGWQKRCEEEWREWREERERERVEEVRRETKKMEVERWRVRNAEEMVVAGIDSSGVVNAAWNFLTGGGSGNGEDRARIPQGRGAAPYSGQPRDSKERQNEPSKSQTKAKEKTSREPEKRDPRTWYERPHNYLQDYHPLPSPIQPYNPAPRHSTRPKTPPPAKWKDATEEQAEKWRKETKKEYARIDKLYKKAKELEKSNRELERRQRKREEAERVPEPIYWSVPGQTAEGVLKVRDDRGKKDTLRDEHAKLFERDYRRRFPEEFYPREYVQPAKPQQQDNSGSWLPFSIWPSNNKPDQKTDQKITSKPTGKDQKKDVKGGPQQAYYQDPWAHMRTPLPPKDAKTSQQHSQPTAYPPPTGPLFITDLLTTLPIEDHNPHKSYTTRSRSRRPPRLTPQSKPKLSTQDFTMTFPHYHPTTLACIPTSLLSPRNHSISPQEISVLSLSLDHQSLTRISRFWLPPTVCTCYGDGREDGEPLYGGGRRGVVFRWPLRKYCGKCSKERGVEGRKGYPEDWPKVGWAEGRSVPGRYRAAEWVVGRREGWVEREREERRGREGRGRSRYR